VGKKHPPGLGGCKHRAFLSILVGYQSVIPLVQLVDIEKVHYRFSAAC
jgi:hypothetical protein